MPDETPKTYGVFISHASEDKAEVARPLAQELERLGVKVWLDEYELTLGDSLRQAIDRGLTQSRFGVVILSPNFFRKEWPQRELDALVAIEGAGKVILPIWHHLTKEQIILYSPLLAGKLAVSTDRGISYVANEILRAIKRESGETIAQPRPEDVRPKRLAELRNRLFLSRSNSELERLSYEVDRFLADYPNDVDGRVLEHDVQKAIVFARPLPAQTRERRAPAPAAGCFPGLIQLLTGKGKTGWSLAGGVIVLLLILSCILVVILQNWR